MGLFQSPLIYLFWKSIQSLIGIKNMRILLVLISKKKNDYNPNHHLYKPFIQQFPSTLLLKPSPISTAYAWAFDI